ncbi:CGNR zinc finger domain-containing protein [Streptomyces sp. PTM05]|uniref:CGNR zinc finger domain-containing protein n=1 Tax=Streptantibioticus parmotrematis TaxID=2873249 RepID=A0ABS7QME5_9ACTN|nr:CGNR zinc finger domain-containing protein [Streptantibioticus parmotrematis]MBY8884361.1 CGNR zinc finger domain-containing protein [Streptantibioticus parmotrematis]
MRDACYSPLAVQAAVDLANTLRPVKGEDALETVEQLRDFLDDHPAAEPPSPAANRGAGPRRLTRADLAEVRALRETVRGVLERANADAVEAAALINDGLRRGRATPVLCHEGDRWWTEVTSDTDRCSAHLAATMLSALAAVIATLGPARLGVCAGPTCRATFVDLSRNGSKQYCTRTCAHRASVAAYRSRHSPR